tara:strand:+ start:305 stop:787 length:483 start_codon:yes stop_codon:yes gene_type:complete
MEMQKPAPPSMVKSIGLDLGTTTGWACAEPWAWGTANFKPRRFEGGGMRFLRFRHWLKELINLHSPEVVYFEEVRRHRGTDAAHVYGGFLGMLTSTCEEYALAHQGIPVGTIKRFATGKGNANKELMITKAQEKWTGVIANDNEADALWCLACGLEGGLS